MFSFQVKVSTNLNAHQIPTTPPSHHLLSPTYPSTMNSGNENDFDWDAEWEALDAADDPDLIYHLAPGTQAAGSQPFSQNLAEFYKKSAQVRRKS